MALRDIFLHAGSDERFGARLEVAVELAAAHKAHLTSVYVATLPKIPERPPAEGHPAVPRELLGLVSGGASARARRNEQIVADRKSVV